MAENLQHEDFGEKIGGAKKDLWKDRGLYVDDLGAMNEREAEKFVKKDNVWKKPDYQAMLDDGVPLGVVYFIKKARDSLGASPQYRYSDKTPELRRARQEEYIETVRQLQAVIEDVRTLDDAMQAYDRFLIQNGYVEQVQGWASGTHYRATKKSLDNPVITNKLVQALHIRSASHFDRDFTQKAQQEQFGVSKDQKMPKGYAIHFNDGKNTYSRNNDWKPGTYYVTKGYERMVNMVWSRKMTGDHPDPRAVDDAMLRVISEKYVVMPLYLLDHSGLAMQTESFHDPWDSGQVGWVYVSKEDVLKEFGGEKMTGALRKKAEDLLRGEVAEYDAYLRGECYGFELYKNGELSDSCWGFIGSLEDACKAMADYLPDECKGMTEHLSEVKEPASMIKTLLRHARIQIEQAEKAHEHAPRQQVLSEAR